MTSGDAEGRQATRRAGRTREPALRAPWPAVALAGLIVGTFALERLGGSVDAAADRWGFLARAPWRDGGATLLTALFVHAGWAHVGLNALAALAFAAPVARRLGTGPRGAAVLAGLYGLSGAVGSLAFAFLAPRALLVGASGAVAGLMGAASRLPGPGARALLPFGAPPVVGMATGWLIVNLAVAFAGPDLGGGGEPVAWQAHLAGYAAGLLLIGPFSRLAGRPP